PDSSPEALQDGRGQRGGDPRPGRGAQASLAQARASGGRRGGAPGAGAALPGPLAAPFLAVRPADRRYVTIALASKIRDVPDFPRPGIVFTDIMPLIAA